MIVRVRLPDGAMTRVSVEASMRADEVLERVLTSAETLDADGAALCRDPRCAQPVSPENATLDALGLKHGDVLYVRAKSRAASEPVAMEHEAGAAAGSTSATAFANGDGAVSENGAGDSKPKPFRCLHGPRGMCEHCMPKEDPRERYQREIDKWKNRNGSSVAVMEALDALKFRIKPQENGAISAASVDTAAANDFQAYLVTTGFSQHRFGLLYGTVDAENVARCDAVYEPPQVGTAEMYVPSEESDASGDGASSSSSASSPSISTRADLVARDLGMVHVGMIFSAKPRKCILSALDVVTAAKLAVREGERRSGAEREFVIISVALAEDGQTLFEAFQLSDQCLEMFRAGVILESGLQKPNSGRVKMRDPVLVEGKETHSVHTEFFLINVPIRGHDGWLRNGAFPAANRELRGQHQRDLVEALRSQRDKPFFEQLADFHLLVFLSAILDVYTDMPGLCALVRDRREPTELEAGYQLMLDAICSSS
mmetsp:Transcript_1017/g.2933  ORF Transcript_1017/g.2933 Transcript_1017/m.2933 type:complete len:485 (-) Transcript_1017:160-1614(-)